MQGRVCSHLHARKLSSEADPCALVQVQKELLQDGVFRAIPGLTSEQAAVVHLNGTWTATLDLAGELYRACFDSQETAVEAFHAAGAVAA